MKIETLTTTADSMGAAVVKGLLEAEGIPVLLRAYQSAGWLFPGTPGCLGAMEVLVPAGRLEEARRLLAAAESDGLRLEETDASRDAAAHGDTGDADGAEDGVDVGGEFFAGDAFGAGEVTDAAVAVVELGMVGGQGIHVGEDLVAAGVA